MDDALLDETFDRALRCLAFAVEHSACSELVRLLVHAIDEVRCDVTEGANFLIAKSLVVLALRGDDDHTHGAPHPSPPQFRSARLFARCCNHDCKMFLKFLQSVSAAQSCGC